MCADFQACAVPMTVNGMEPFECGALTAGVNCNNAGSNKEACHQGTGTTADRSVAQHCVIHLLRFSLIRAVAL